MAARRGRPHKSRLTPERIRSLGRDRQALQLRLRALTFDEIAKVCGYASRGHAYQGVSRALKESLREPADQLRELEGQRYDLIWQKLVLKLEKAEVCDLPVISNALMRVAERRAKLLGLDAPEKIDLLDRSKVIIVEEDDWRGVPKPE